MSEMTRRERVRRTLHFETPDRVPRHLWTLPAIQMFRNDELQKLQQRWPDDIVKPGDYYSPSTREKGDANRKGTYIDAWGCPFENAEDGIIGQVKHPPLDSKEKIEAYQPPWELLDGADFKRVNRMVDSTDAYVLAGTWVRPFERMQFLLGSEQFYMQLAYGTAEVMNLLERIHEFNLKEISMWAETDVQGIQWLDDWGSQRSLLISPRSWREIFKPLYKEYCDIIHGAGKDVFFHSDGDISDIYEDLVEIGITAQNSQLFCMDMDELAQKVKGKIAFWGEIDRQQILPSGSVEDVKAAVRKVHDHLYDPTGGIIAQCEWGPDCPYENVEAVFAEWDRLSGGEGPAA